MTALRLDPMQDLTEEFNSTARAFLDKEASCHLLLTKYSLLFNFKATEAEQKEKLAAALFDSSIKLLSSRASPAYRGYITEADFDAANAMLLRLQKPDSAPFLPAHAAESLAKVGFDFVSSAEKDIGIDSHKLARFAALCLDHAEKFREIAENRHDDLTTGKNIAPAKRIMLKPKPPAT